MRRPGDGRQRWVGRGGGAIAGVGLAVAIAAQSVAVAGPLLHIGAAGAGAAGAWAGLGPPDAAGPLRPGLGRGPAPGDQGDQPEQGDRAGQGDQGQGGQGQGADQEQGGQGQGGRGQGDRGRGDWAGQPVRLADWAGSEEARSGRPRAVGCGFHGLWSIYDDALRAAVLDRLRAAGVRSVRIDLSWVMLQPDGPGSYYPWGVALVDHVIAMANDRGIAPLMTLWLTPPWANGGAGERALPDRPADYARVAGWAAARWRGRVAGWEVWNEPNSPAFLRGADPAGYVRLLRAAYPAIKAVAPEAPVVLGGLEYNDTAWLSRAYDAGVRGAFDVLATHPYQGIADLGPSAVDGTKWTLRHAAAVHRLMAARGDGRKPIWFTEFGWSTHGDASELNWLQGVSEAQQAAYLARTATLVGAEMPYVTRIYWSTDRDLSTGDIQYRNYGLFRRDLSAKPALWALAAVNEAARTG